MGMMHPAFNTTGKKKGKVKFKSAEAKREAERLEQEWEELKKRHVTKVSAQPTNRPKYMPQVPPGRSTNRHVPSLNSTSVADVGARKEAQQYTGTEVLGISIMHKSCLQPVFSEQQAKDAASMRR